MRKNRRDKRAGASALAPQPAAGTKSLTVGMGGFDGLISTLGRVPLLVNRALPLAERGEFERAESDLTDVLVHVELAKAAILGNLAYIAMKAGDVGKATGYVDIALQSLTELGLETTDIGKMLSVVHANLPADKPEAAAAGADAPAPADVSVADGSAGGDKTE